MSCVEMVGAALDAAGKTGSNATMLSRERLAVWMYLPTVEFCAFCAMTRCTGARFPARPPPLQI